MNARAVPMLAGAALAASATGAASALTAIPPPVMFAAAIALSIVVNADDRRTAAPTRGRAATILWTTVGALCALLLPVASPPAPGHVISHSADPSLHGDLFDVLDALDREPTDVIGRTVSVSGDWMPAEGDVPATVSRRVMSCCAADAVDVGFDVDMFRPRAIPAGARVRVTGIIDARMRDGETRYVLERSDVAALEDYDHRDR
jgi:hypothetical protein